MRWSALVLLSVGCVVPWAEPDDFAETDDTQVDTDDTVDTDTEDTDGGGGDGIELANDCADAADLALLQDGAYAGTFRNLDPSGLDPDCPSIAAAKGAEGYRRVRVKNGDTLTVTLIANAEGKERDVVITLLDACASDACVRGADSAVKGGMETLTWKNDTGGPADMILGLHLFDTSQAGGDFELTVERK